MRSLLIVIAIGGFALTSLHANTAKTGMRNISAMALVQDMTVGWSLGNTLDAKGKDETAWGNPRTTKAMIDEIAKMGFKTFRLPVTWDSKTGGAPDYAVSAAWMDRVEEVANYAFANNMYVILNTHHEGEWLVPTKANMDKCKQRLEKLWTQIANRFKEYGDYLVFETLNEPRHEGSSEEWTGGSEEGRDVVNQYHKTCVDAIRATGGNNATRKLMIATYAASTVPKAIDALVIPNNDANTIVSLHSYFPYFFCLEGSQKTWGSDKDKRDMDAEFDKIHTKLVSKGKAVVLGEWCNIENGDNLPDRLRHADYYTKACIKRNITPVWWDAGGTKNPAWLLNRKTLKWMYPELIDTLTQIKRVTVKTNEGKPNNIYGIYDIALHVSKKLSFTYNVDQPSSVSINILSLSGKKISSRNLGYQQKGRYSHVVHTDLKDGMYILNLNTDYGSKAVNFGHLSGSFQ